MVVVSNIFCFYPYLGKWSNLTMGWNHQLVWRWYIAWYLIEYFLLSWHLNGKNCYYEIAAVQIFGPTAPTGKPSVWLTRLCLLRSRMEVNQCQSLIISMVLAVKSLKLSLKNGSTKRWHKNCKTSEEYKKRKQPLLRPDSVDRSPWIGRIGRIGLLTDGSWRFVQRIGPQESVPRVWRHSSTFEKNDLPEIYKSLMVLQKKWCVLLMLFVFLLFVGGIGIECRCWCWWIVVVIYHTSDEQSKYLSRHTFMYILKVLCTHINKYIYIYNFSV